MSTNQNIKNEDDKAYVDTKNDSKDHLLENSHVGESERVRRHNEYRKIILSDYQPMHRELFQINAGTFFVPSFLKAISENTEESFRNIIYEPSPGILTFEMLQPEFCKMLLDEYKNFEKWVQETGFEALPANTMNRYGACLDHFGMETMLSKLMEDFILPMSTVFFPEVGGATLDSHHGFIVEYGTDRDDHIDFHVDDSEVTLNVCLGEQFSGGDLFFRGVRCDEHVNVESEPEEIFDYSHVPGRAVMHCGRHRHGTLSTTSGHRVNMLLWCRSSIFRNISKYEKKSQKWCKVCQRERKERKRRNLAAISQLKLQKIAGGSTCSRTDSNP